MNVLSVTGPSICDGLGCRTVIWFAGCKHKCPGCHNPWTWNYNQGTPIFDKRLMDKIFKSVKPDYIKGITLSGGDPLDQTVESIYDLIDFLTAFKEKYPNKDIWIYSGDTFENLITNVHKTKVLELCDILVDGPFILERKDVTIGFRGSNNQRIIDLKQSLKEKHVIEYKLED